IDPGTGVISGTLGFASAGSYPISVSASDGTLSATDAFTLTVVNTNRNPTFDQDIDTLTSAEGSSPGLSAGATDPDGDSLTYAATGLPTGLSINVGTGLISGTIAFTAAAGSPYSVTVTVRDGAAVDATDTFTWNVTNTNRAPVVDTATITPSGPTTAQTLTATVTSHDADGDTLTPSFQWTRNGADISGATASTLNLATAGNGDRGDVIRVRVTVSDGNLTSGPVTASPVTVANSAPVFSTNFVTRSDVEGDAISLDANASDADTDTLTYGATGLPAGISIDPLTGVLSGTLSGTSAGSYTVSITVTDGTLTDTDTLPWTVTNANTAPVMDSVSVAPSGPTTNQTLTATPAAHDAEGDSLTYAFQWTRNGADISGATSATLNLATAGNGNRGDAIRVRVTASDGTASSGPLTSDPVTVADSAPSASVALTPPAPGTGATLTATVTAADADGDTLSLHYVWKVNGVTRRTIDSAALTDTFDLSVAGNGDPGDSVAVEVTPSDGSLSGSLATSSVTVAASGLTVYANDLFSRTSTDTWASAGTGGAYLLQGTAANYDVTGSTGSMAVAAGANRSALLTAVSALDVDLGFRVSSDRLAAGGAQFVYGVARRTSATAEYRIKLRIAANGAVFVQASSVTGNVETALGTEVRVTAITHAANSFIRVRAQLSGSSPTTIRIRAWNDGGSEPSAWQYTVTNAAAGLQTAGAVGLRAYVGSATTNGPVLFTFDDFRVTSIPAP
ncbi:MAG: hypothetical protein QOH61_1967, partial [Chloroflexota bacterium]|nr:hypothetical protein [Chloroflexota bacterium]